MQAPRFLTLSRGLIVVGTVIAVATTVVSRTPAPWWVVACLSLCLFADTVLLWAIECELHKAEKLADYYEDALRDLRKELDRG